MPTEERAAKPKWQIALDLLDTMREEGLPHALVVADAGYGAGGEFREGLEARGERYIVGLLGEELVFAEPPRWAVRAPKRRGRPPTRAHLVDGAPRPVAVKTLAEGLEHVTVRWREGTKGWLEADFAWVRVWIGHRWERGVPIEAIPDPEAEARWLLVEWRKDGTVKYALSNLPPETTLEQAVPRWKERWQVERGYLQLKDELGLDHFEGRGWPGFHHHATMTFLAYGFLALERRRAQSLHLTDPPGEARRGA